MAPPTNIYYTWMSSSSVNRNYPQSAINCRLFQMISTEPSLACQEDKYGDKGCCRHRRCTFVHLFVCKTWLEEVTLKGIFLQKICMLPIKLEMWITGIFISIEFYIVGVKLHGHDNPEPRGIGILTFPTQHGKSNMLRHDKYDKAVYIEPINIGMVYVPSIACIGWSLQSYVSLSQHSEGCSSLWWIQKANRWT